jgi:hypothetical protein
MPKAQYPAIFTKANTVLESKNSGQPYINCEFTLDEGEYKGRKAWNIVSLQQQSLWAVKRFAVTLGVPPEELEQDFDTDELFARYYGTKVLLDVDVETVPADKSKTGESYQRNVVKNVLPYNSELTALVAGNGKASKNSPF